MENSLILDNVLNRHRKFRKNIPLLQKEVEEIIDIIAEEEGLTTTEVRSIIVSQFRFIAAIIKSCSSPKKDDFNPDAYKSVRLPYIGRFESKKSFRRKYTDYK